MILTTLLLGFAQAHISTETIAYEDYIKQQLADVGEYDALGEEKCLTRLEQEGISAKIVIHRKTHYGLLRYGIARFPDFPTKLNQNRENEEITITESSGAAFYFFRVPSGNINEDFWCLAESL